MIVFDNLWVLMKEKGVSTYQLREKCGIDSKTIRRLRANDNMETKTLNKLCAVLSCEIGDIAKSCPGLIRHKIASTHKLWRRLLIFCGKKSRKSSREYPIYSLIILTNTISCGI